jgi:hypothetical protein
MQEMDEKSRTELMAHIKEHASYPISKKDLVAGCSNMSHVPQATRDWVAMTLPDRTYSSADDVIHALDMPHEH